MAAVGGGGMPGGLSAKQQKLFELRMRMVRARCLLAARGRDNALNLWA